MPIQGIEGKEDPARLAPKCGFVSAEAVKGKIGQVSQTQKTLSELSSRPFADASAVSVVSDIAREIDRKRSVKSRLTCG